MITELTVIETREHVCKYEVDAENLVEAIQKAEAGDTVYEYEVHCGGVSNRYIESVGNWDKNGEPVNG